MTYRCEACGEPLPPKGKGRRRRFFSDRCKDSGRRQRNFDATGRSRPDAHFVASDTQSAPTPYVGSDMPRKPEKRIAISATCKPAFAGPRSPSMTGEERRRLIRNAHVTELSARWPITNVS
jgi:hypothetical protein